MDCSKPDLKMDFTISSITCVPGDVLIKFQAKYLSDCEPDYHILQREIQLVEKENKDLDIGEFCLVQDKPLGLWHRGEILNKFKERYEVVLIDRGDVIKVPFEQIASPTGELFALPPKMVNGIFSSVLPLGEKWSPRAVNFFTSLIGEQHNGHVKTFLPHQVVLLEVPKVINYAVELHVAKYVDSETFCLLVELIHKFPANSQDPQTPDLLQQKELTLEVPLSLNDNSKFLKLLDHLKPDISVGTMEKIKISAATSPDRFYCHILTWETELHKLTASMCSHYDSLKTEASSTCGTLCAAKRKDGLWYRGIIQALLSCRDVKVWFIDIGSSETIQSKDVHQLKRDFLLLPMLAIPCTFSRVNYQKKSPKSIQLSLFKQALMGDIVIAHIEQFCNEERVFDISLYKKEYELNSECHLTYQQVPFFSPDTYTGTVKSEHQENNPDTALPKVSESIEMDKENVVSFKAVQMDPDSIHVAYVEYVLNPSNFWIRIDECNDEFSAMMAEIAERYDKCELMEMVIDDPQPGQLCCALYPKDCHYYRALITEVNEPKVSVYFIDFGNTETVSFYEVKVLSPEFSTLPGLAMCCTLAYVYPQEDVWVKSANDLFKGIVAGKAVLCHVLEKQKFKYVVEMRLLESSGSSDIVSLLVQAGYAEFWKVDLKSKSVDHALPEISTKCKLKSGKKKVECAVKGDIKVSLRECKMKIRTNQQVVSFCEPSNLVSSNISSIYFKQYTFSPGAIVDVKCSHVVSPGHFWCQYSCNLTALDTLMDEIQTFYKVCNSRYLQGQMACIARSSCTGKYYRASVVKQVSRNEVNVIFVDYGMVEKVFISELREIKPQFLKWEGQAFRCCLSKVFYNPHRTWSDSACKDFKGFVDSATDMKCTVIVVFINGSEGLCNAVDLNTPCIEASHWLASKGHLNLQGTVKVPSVLLHTFCYSSFNLEVGSNESIYITFIYNTGKFYCQPAKNENTVEILMRKVFELGEKINPETRNKVNDLCIVKHIADGNFYRATASAVDSDHSLAFFVDFGDSHMVKKTELLPIPEEAVDILFEPMQAIPCYLSGLKETMFTTEAKTWFEEQFIDRTVSATVVSKDNKGQLELDLCCGNVSINCKLKGILGVEIKPKALKSASHAESISTALPVRAKNHTLQELDEKSESYGKDKKTHKSDVNGNVIPDVNSRFILDSHQNAEALQKGNNKASKSPSSMHVRNSCSPPSPKKPLKSTDLPKMVLETGSNHLVYASHISSHSEFYIQLAEYEKQVLQLEVELNDMSFQPIDVNHLEKGSLVVAQYPDDKAFYRAEIKDILKANFYEIEFIDYGNKAKVDFSSIFKLPERFFNVPRLSISVFLTSFQKYQNGKLCQSAVDRFSEKLENRSFSCTFLHRHESQWEVSITLEGQSATEFLQSFKAPPELSALDKKDTVPKLATEFLQSFKTPPESSALDKKDTVPKLAREFPQSFKAPPESSALDKKDTVPKSATEFLQSFKAPPESSALDKKDTVPRLDFTLKPNQIEKVKTIYLSKIGMLYVTLARFAEESKMNEHISAVVEQSDSWLKDNDMSEGMICLAKSEKMKTWLRAVVEKIFQKTKEMMVFFVDHCAREVISMHNAKSLPARVLPLPHQAICCKWIWMQKVGIHLFQSEMHSILLDKLHILFLKFLETESCWKVDLVLDDIMLMEHFNTVPQQVTQKLSDAVACCQLETKSLTFSIPRVSLRSLEVISGFVTAFQDPFNFSVQLENSIFAMNKLSKLINELTDDILPLNKDLVRPGSACLVKCSEFDQWCRAEIVSINTSSIMLNLPDYGVYKSIPYSDYSKLKVVSKEIASLPALTFRCRLYGVLPKNGNRWPACAVEYCMDFIQGRDLLILPNKIIDTNVTEVSIYGQGNLADKLIFKGLASDARNHGCFQEAVAEPITTVS